MFCSKSCIPRHQALAQSTAHAAAAAAALLLKLLLCDAMPLTLMQSSVLVPESPTDILT
jgi:hypothetical protein